jgi:hypothetical protein
LSGGKGKKRYAEQHRVFSVVSQWKMKKEVECNGGMRSELLPERTRKTKCLKESVSNTTPHKTLRNEKKKEKKGSKL